MPGTLCEHCTAACCRYIALPIEEPTEPSDFEDIRWYLIHENINVFVEDGDWYLHISTNCRHLLPDHRCGIYETRPQICRDYTTENCDYHSGDYGWEQHFTCPEHLDEYIQTVYLPDPDNAREIRQAQKSRKMHSQIKAKYRRQRRARTAVERYARVDSDIQNVPLPVLRTR